MLSNIISEEFPFCNPRPLFNSDEFLEAILTNPKLNTINAATACASNPHPNVPTFPAQIHRSHKKYPAAKP